MKTTLRLMVVSLLTVLIAGTGFGWGNATHTYYAKNLTGGAGHLGYNEMYGAVLTDAFNLMLDEKGTFMSAQLHTNFMLLVEQANTCGRQASAFGVVIHNDVWGADYTAHHNSFTFPGEGYAEVKGAVLAPTIISVLVPILMDAGLDEPTATAIATGLAPTFGHDLSETAVDILLRSVDPLIGADIVQAAQRRSSDVGYLLAEAYAASLAGALNIPIPEAKKFIMNAEREYRDLTIQYGQILMLPDDQAIGALAVFNAMVAEEFIKGYTGIEISIAPEIVAGVILQAIAAVTPDFGAELAQTLAYLGNELALRGIETCSDPATFANSMSAPLLGENYPNPFNPSTTIRYSLPERSHVTLSVFNELGQQVVTLVEGVVEAGNHEVRFDAFGLSSGVYFSRLQTGDVVQIRKLLLLR